MSKKYKLIKCYPGSPKIGDVAEYIESAKYYYVKNKGSYAKLNVENQPEFWQEVKEEFPKIIGIIKKDKSEILLDNSNIDNWLQNYGKNIWEIYQVAKSKDEIFTIGDKVTWDHYEKYKAPYFTIDKFFIRESDNKLQIKYKELPNSEHSFYPDLEKVKEPLFITEDGVEIFEGDKFYFIDVEYKTCLYYAYKNINFKKESKFPIFSLIEKSEKWIEDNKPRFSKKQVLDAINSNARMKILGLELYVNKKEFKENLGI